MEPPRPTTTPLWLKAAIAVFVVFSLYNYMGEDAKQGAVKDGKGPLQTSFRDNLTDYTHTVFPGLIQLTKSEDVTQGTGATAYCGTKVTIAYATRRLKKDEKESKADTSVPPADSKDELTFTLGAHTVMPALEEGVEGMRAGGERKVLSPPHLAYDVKGFEHPGVPPGAEVEFDVTLKKVEPAIHSEGFGLRALDVTERGYDPVECGDQVAITLTVWAADGRKLFTTPQKKPLIFTPGMGTMFAGLEEGVLGMIQEGRRTLIVPPEWQVSLDKDKGAPLFTPQKEAVIADVLLLERKRYTPEVKKKDHDDTGRPTETH